MARTPQWPPIKERPNRGGSVSYVLECGFQPKDGGGRKRIRFYKKTHKDAETLGRELRLIRKERGLKAAQAHAAALSGLDECLLKLRARGLTIKDAVSLALRSDVQAPSPLTSTSLEPATNVTPESTGTFPSKSPTVAEVIEEFIAARIEAKKGEAPIDHENIMKLVLRKALKQYLGKPIREIGVADITEVLKATRTRATRGNWLSNLNNLFTYASAKGIEYIGFNPAASAIKATSYGPSGGANINLNVEAVEVLSPQDIVRLLRFVEQVPEYRCMVVPLSLQIYCGFRRVEVQRIAREELLQNVGKDISVIAKRTRSRMNRWVTMNETIHKWLSRWLKADAPIYPNEYPELLRRIVRELKLKWVRNILRHTFASNYRRKHGEEKTVEAMGHAISDTTFKFYLRKITQEDARLFWAIEPSVPPPIFETDAERNEGFYTLAQVMERSLQEDAAQLSVITDVNQVG